MNELHGHGMVFCGVLSFFYCSFFCFFFNAQLVDACIVVVVTHVTHIYRYCMQDENETHACDVHESSSGDVATTT